MVEVDDLLGRMREAPLPPRLAMMDQAVLDAVATQRSRANALGAPSMTLAAIAALVIGVAGSALPGTAARAEPGPSLFGTELAPSTLLGTGR